MSTELADTLASNRKFNVSTPEHTEGFRGALLLADRNTDRGISITLWDTEVEMQAGVASVQEQRARLADLLGPTVREVYEVSVQESMPGEGAPKYARVGTGQIQQSRMDETISVMRDTNFPGFRQQQGFKGGFLFTDSSTDKAIHLSLWETEADITASDARLQEQRQRIREGQTRPPVVEHYEVSVQV